MQNYILNEGYQDNLNLFYNANGSKIFLKKKKFIDLSMCAGSIILGHNHPFLKKTINKIFKKKISNLAAPNIFAENFAKNILSLSSNFKKVIFCNSGTEAVIKSLRIARAIKKKSKIGYVIGGWHGSVDALLYKSSNNLKPLEISSGLAKENEKNLVMLPYNDIEKTKKILNKNKKNMSSVIIEPIQGSLPDPNIKNYLKFLEKYCKKNNLILIFDEMITGLRTDFSCIQKYFGIRSDITLFGKCFGAGYPIGIIIINKKIQDNLSKLKRKVFFGGTFSGNSFVSFVGNETFNYIKKNKIKIFKKINNQAQIIEKNLNTYFKKNNLDLKIYRFKSMLRLVYTNKTISNRIGRDFLESKNNDKMIKFKKFINDQKIYIPGSGLMFLSYSHSLKETRLIIEKIKVGSLKYFKK